KDDSCIECHMPRFSTSNVAHTAATDHRIPRFRERVSGALPAKDAKVEKYPLAYFPPDLNFSEMDRDLGIALTGLAHKAKNTRLASQALRLLEPGLQRYPDDFQAWEAKGHALSLLGQPRQALEAYERVLHLRPQREYSLIGAAVQSARLQEPQAAIDYWKRAIQVDAGDWQPSDELASLLAAQQEWKAAAEQCHKALELYPTSLETRKLLVECYLRLGDQARARAEIDLLISLDPDPERSRGMFGDRQN